MSFAQQIEKSVDDAWRDYIRGMNRTLLRRLVRLVIRAWVESEGLSVSKDVDVSIPVDRGGRPETITIRAAEFTE